MTDLKNLIEQKAFKPSDFCGPSRVGRGTVTLKQAAEIANSHQAASLRALLVAVGYFAYEAQKHSLECEYFVRGAATISDCTCGQKRFHKALAEIAKELGVGE